MSSKSSPKPHHHKNRSKDKKRHNVSKHFVHTGQLSTSLLSKRPHHYDTDTATEWKKRTIQSNHDKYDEYMGVKHSSDEDPKMALQRHIEYRKQRKMDYLDVLIRMNSKLVRDGKNDGRNEWLTSGDDAFAQMDLSDILQANWIEDIPDDNFLDPMDFGVGIEREEHENTEMQEEGSNVPSGTVDDVKAAQEEIPRPTTQLDSSQTSKTELQFLKASLAAPELTKSTDKNIDHALEELMHKERIAKPEKPQAPSSQDKTTSNELDELDSLLLSTAQAPVETTRRVETKIKAPPPQDVDDIDDFLDNL
uniref:Uncharacterized protein n=1 Tax=Percolomonas cosmopolitus TaxID=63605 RepID=A0A7S1KNL5_9EUKA